MLEDMLLHEKHHVTMACLYVRELHNVQGNIKITQFTALFLGPSTLEAKILLLKMPFILANGKKN